ncbi:hypothetical protein MHH52_28515 [Paenibacillus sp. FSL K6-0276]|uniref:hypothetical protein n=1 Tax=Paenibacillus sp. FSL K6-0276 TaxID=2921450 RepID=UPI0030EE214C
MSRIKQKEYDIIIEKIRRNYKEVTLAEYKLLVEFICGRYTGHDPILSTLSNQQLRLNNDYFGRSYYDSMQYRKRWGPSSKHYILSNLYKSSYGLTSESRKKIFVEEEMVIFQDNVSFGNRTGFALFKFFVKSDIPYLLMVHEYGYNSITNKIEELVAKIENEYLSDFGFGVIEDNVQIYYKESKDFYDQVTLEKGLKQPNWRTLDPHERQWFDQTWDSIESESKEEQEQTTFFFEKGKQFDAYNTIKNIFANVRKELFIVDNYVDSTLFLMLETVNLDVRIKLLTSKMQGDAPVAVEKFKAQRGNFEWYKAKDFHDRYIFADNDCYLLGASIKDFANKATTLVAIKDKQVIKLIRTYAVDKFTESSTIKDEI